MIKVEKDNYTITVKSIEWDFTKNGVKFLKVGGRITVTLGTYKETKRVNSHNLFSKIRVYGSIENLEKLMEEWESAIYEQVNSSAKAKPFKIEVIEGYINNCFFNGRLFSMLEVAQWKCNKVAQKSKKENTLYEYTNSPYKLIPLEIREENLKKRKETKQEVVETEKERLEQEYYNNIWKQ